MGLNSNNKIEYFHIKMNTTTIVFFALMGIVFFPSIVYVYACSSKNFIRNKRIIDSLPQILSTLGVLGTFWGITQGLWEFDVHDINASIPKLLDGLRTAFYTSLAGMISSLLLRAVTDGKSDKVDKGLSDMQAAQVEICKAIQQMSEVVCTATKELSTTVTTEIKKIAATQSEFSSQMINVVQNIQTDAHGISELNGVSGILQTLQTNSNNLILSAQGQSGSLRSLVELGSVVSKYIVAINEHTNHIGTGVEEIKSLKDALHGEVMEIEEAMQNTNSLLTEKFDEFSTLLQKSNTEALVEVMKNVTDEFNKQMTSLINKLIQENFEQLNKSVERLNTWQQENKEMIQSLVVQYKQMAQEFDGTSTTLTRVSEDTELLISRGGTLSQLVETLKAVMIDDVKFSQITKNLSETAALTQKNMESFDETTNHLNLWVRNQRDFNEGVRILIAKLDELNRIRDYGEHFWSDTKKHMDEGIAIIRQGSKSLNEQLLDIDKRFYERLGTTLAELDACISAMVEHYNN